MKKYLSDIFITLLIALGFSTVSLANTQRSSTPYSDLLKKDAVCEGQQKLMESFIVPSEKTNENGEKLVDEKTKEPITEIGKLTENEDLNGSRVFNFEAIQDAIIRKPGDKKTKDCLIEFHDAAMQEWAQYFFTMSEEFGCGFETKEPAEKKGDSEILEIVVNPAKKKDTCDIIVPGGTAPLSEVLLKPFKNLERLYNKFNNDFDEAVEAQKKVQPAPDKAKTEGAVAECNGGPGCDKPLSLGTDIYKLTEASDIACCNEIKKNWETVGFSPTKNVKPDDRVCKELIDKDSDEGYFDGGLENCLKNGFNAFTRDFFKSIASLFEWEGFGSQLMTLWREMKADPTGAPLMILKKLGGFEDKYASCLNKKAQGQYACQLVGKFFGNNAGFAFGVGGAVGLVKGIRGVYQINKDAKKGMKMLEQITGEKRPVPKKGYIIASSKQAVSTAVNAAKTSMLWPYHSLRGVVGVGSLVKEGLGKIPAGMKRAGQGAANVGTTVGLAAAESGGKAISRLSKTEAMKEAGTTMTEAAKKARAKKPDVPEAAPKVSDPVPLAPEVPEFKRWYENRAKFEMKQANAQIAKKDFEINARIKERDDLLDGATKGKKKSRLLDEDQRMKVKNLESEIETLTKDKTSVAEQLKKLQEARAYRAKQLISAPILGAVITGKSVPRNPEEVTEAKKDKNEKPATATPIVGNGTGVTTREKGTKAAEPAKPAAAPSPAADTEKAKAAASDGDDDPPEPPR